MKVYPQKLTQQKELEGQDKAGGWGFCFCLSACLILCFNGYEVSSYMFIEVAHDSECRKERKININVPYKILSIILLKPYEFLYELFTAAVLPRLSSYSQMLPIISGPWQQI